MVAPNYLGKKLRVIQKATKTGYPTTSKTSGTVTIALGFAPGNSVGPTTSLPSPQANAPVTVNPGSWSPTPSGFAYQWKYSATDLLDGPFTKIAGATSATFTPPASLAGKHLWVDVTTKLTGYAAATEIAYAGVVTVGVIKNLTPPEARDRSL